VVPPQREREVHEEYTGRGARARRPYHEAEACGGTAEAERAGALNYNAGEVCAEDGEGDGAGDGEGGSAWGEGAAPAEEEVACEVLVRRGGVLDYRCKGSSNGG